MTEQLGFDLGFISPIEKNYGTVHIEPVRSKSILTKGTGFIAGVDYSINPYRGCQHNCSFCFAAAFSPTPEKKEAWGKWVDAKTNAAALIKKLPPKSLQGKKIVLSSVTDPYQAAEKTYQITRDCLKALIPHEPRIIIQTHGTLVTRDIDLLQEFTHRSVNISITTDCEEIRKEFEPSTPSIAARLEALHTLEKAGISTRATICPMLPVKDPLRFAEKLLQTGCKRFAAQYFHNVTGDYTSSTRDVCLPQLARHQWTPEAYRNTFLTLQKALAPFPLLEGDKSLEYEKLVLPLESIC